MNTPTEAPSDCPEAWDRAVSERNTEIARLRAELEHVRDAILATESDGFNRTAYMMTCIEAALKGANK